MTVRINANTKWNGGVALRITVVSHSNIEWDEELLWAVEVLGYLSAPLGLLSGRPDRVRGVERRELNPQKPLTLTPENRRPC